MNKTTALLVAGTIAGMSAPAMAQSTDGQFTGFRAGVTAGYDAVQAGSSVDIDNEPNNNDQSIDGLAYGVVLGYDVDLGGAVVGVEGEYTDSTASTNFDDGDFEGFGLGEVDAGRDLYIGARVGARIAPDALLYAKGGYTNAKLNILSDYGTVETDRDFKLDGWRAGAGVEYAVNPNTYVNLEYRYSNYSDANIEFADGSTSRNFDVDLDRHQVMAGVGMRF
ncbi:outer membrane beta-barrel protein [Qipengyuania sp. GH25]|uniref:Outer membrane beta-barrel protein n=1 Tax=Qipengyuania pacifica TaxID=2860199 RepID=A0ABS7JH51_9SPHN|nr:porin [Qipengyuania aerophila]MBX7488079.1 outer membrane beta-barrel protein [Qipengyuania aerophila]